MRGRWPLVIVSFVLSVGGAWYFLRPRELPYEPISRPVLRVDGGMRRAADAGAVPSRKELVDVLTVDPTFVLDVRYATENNFLGRKVYPDATVRLQRHAAERLARVQARLRERGLRLKIYDGYRPVEVQREMWKVLPDPRYVADPAVGSRHNVGLAVDVTLVDAEGRELPMPTGWDDFTPAAAADAPAGEPARTNRQVLRDAMEAEGFRVLATEWWHYDAPAPSWRRWPNTP